MDANKFKITNTLKPNAELKIEPRVLNFEQMNKTLGLDQKKPPTITESKPTPTLKNHRKSSDSVDSSQEIMLDDLKTRLKAFQDRDPKADVAELQSMGLNARDILPGEFINEQFNAEVLIASLKCNGLILLTNYRIIIMPINEKFLRCLRLRSEFIEVPYLLVDSLKRNLDRKANPPLALFEIVTKDYREIRIKFIMDEELTLQFQESIFAFLLSSINPSFVELYALQFAKTLKKLDNEFKGWELYNPDYEWLRQGLRIFDKDPDPKDFQFKFLDNSQGKICTTYPEKLVVPFRVHSDFLLKSAGFRSRERLPALTFGFTSKNQEKPLKKVGLYRCSQCKTGLNSNRCFEDEALVRAIGEDSLNGQGKVKIFDARPYMNAVANKVNGKGYEDINCYRNAEITFLEIPNIHKVREAYRKVKEPGEAGNNDKPEMVPWLECIARILKGTAEMAQCLKEGVAVLLHCSDGWDRTSQLSALTQLVLDPYYRTFEGFFALIEKDWVGFGHQFATRCGHEKNSQSDERSPIFIQFLDCVHQIFHQYPLSFEFTPTLLCDIAYYLYTCYFGTFLMDSIIERDLKCKFQESTVSLWSFLLANREKYTNPFYKTPKELDQTETIPVSAIKVLRLWKEHFMRSSLDCADHYGVFEGAMFPEDNLMVEYASLKRENTVLKKGANEMMGELEGLKAELQRFKEKFGEI